MDQPPKSRLSLPLELIPLIGENLDIGDLKSFLQVCRCFSQLLTPIFNHFALRPRYRTTAFYWAVATKNYDLASMLIEKGNNFVVNDIHKTAIMIAPEETPLQDEILDMLWDHKDQITVQDTFNFCTPLHDAVRYGRNHIFQLLLEMGANIDTGDIRGWTPLHHATWEGNKFAVRLLLCNGSNTDTQDLQGMTPLHLAVYQGYKVIAGLLLAAGTDVSLRDSGGWTPIEMREFRHNDSMLSMLLKSLDSNYKSGLNQTALHLAINFGEVEIVIASLDKGVDINAQDAFGSTALYDAATAGNSELVNLLLARGAVVDIQDIRGLTPLHSLVLGWPETLETSVTALLDKGADVQTRDNNGNTIFDNLDSYFETESDISLFEKLLAKTDINFRTKDRKSPLHIAVDNGRDEFVLALIDKGIDINDKDKDGCTALHTAVTGRIRESKVRLLIDKGANVTAKNEDGMTPIDIAIGMGNLTATLLEAVDNNNFRTAYHKQTLLHLSVQISDLRLTSIFIDKGIGINIQDTFGRTPLYYAAFGLDWEMIALLMDRCADNTIKDNNGITPLCGILHLVKGGLSEKQVMLLARGIDLESKDNDGNTPLDLAIKYKHKDAVKVLQMMKMSRSL